MRITNALRRGWRAPAVTVFLWLLASTCAKADTLYFIATLDNQGQINQSWFSPNNWYIPSGNTFVPANRIPESTDNAVLTTSPVQCAANSISVTTLTVQGVTVVGGNFSLINLITYPSAGGGAPTFSGSTVQVQNEFELTVGPFGAGAVFSASTLIIDQGGFILFDAGTTLNLAGNSTLYNEGQVVMTAGSTLLFTGGTNQFSILPNAVLSGSGTTTVLNGGGPGSLLFDNNGTVRGDAGFMTLNMGGVIWTNSLGLGKYSTSVSNATVEITGSYMLQAGNTNKFFGPGLIWFFGAIANATNNGVFILGDPDPASGIMRWNASVFGTGRMDVVGLPGSPSQFLWDGGTINYPMVLNIDGWSQLIITNASTKTLSGGIINNGGSARWLTDNGTISLDNGAVFNNLATGTFSVENNALLQGGAGTNASVFNNAGIFRKTNSTGNTQLFQDATPKPGPYFINTGTLDVQSGRLLLLGGTNTGQFNSASPARLEFQTAYTHNPGASFSGNGTNIVDAQLFLNTGVTISNLTVAGPGVLDGPGDLAIANLLALSFGSTIQGSGGLTINSNSTFSVPNAANLSRNVTNGGNTVLGTSVSSGSFNAGTNVFWTNQPSGTVSLFQSGGFSMSYVGTPPIFNNGGLVQNALPNTSASIGWTFTNIGQVSISATGQLSFSKGFTQTAGSTVISNRGIFSVSGTPATAFINGGTFSGNGTVNGSIVNSSTVHPGGSPGLLTMNGGFTNTPGGIFAIELDGTNAATEFSQLNNNGNHASFNGTLSISLGNGFAPALGSSFKIYSNGVPHGAFSSIQGAHVGGGVVLVPQYHSSDVTLMAASDPIILSPSHTGTSSSFSFQSTAGLTNVIEFTDSLNPQNWQTLTTIPGDGSLKLVTDNAATAPTRFYRVRFQ